MLFPACPPGPVVVVGDVMTDIIVRPEGPIVRGSDRAATIEALPGGSGANQAAWLAARGLPVILAARVGAADAALHRRHLERHGVTPVLALDEARASGTLVTLLDADGERSFLTDRGANAALCSDDLPTRLLDGAALLHVSGYALLTASSRAGVLALMAAARERSVPVSVDPGSAGFLREAGPARFLDWTAGSDLLMPNADEAALLAGTADEAAQLDALAGLYPLVVVKRGARGAVAAAGSVRLAVPAPAVAALDTTGAGDAFLAGFLATGLAGGDIAACLAAAVSAGAEAVTRLGGRPPGLAGPAG